MFEQIFGKIDEIFYKDAGQSRIYKTMDEKEVLEAAEMIISGQLKWVH